MTTRGPGADRPMETSEMEIDPALLTHIGTRAIVLAGKLGEMAALFPTSSSNADQIATSASLLTSLGFDIRGIVANWPELSGEVSSALNRVAANAGPVT